MDAYVDCAELELRFTPLQVRLAFTDNGTNSLSEPALDLAIDTACREADAILGTAWPSAEARTELMAQDAALRGAVCVLVMHGGTFRRPEFRGGNGQWPYEEQAKAARALLNQYAKAHLKSPGEATAGANPMRTLRVSGGPPFEFGSTPDHKPRGGY